MADNPWHVDSIQAFTFLRCPECIFDTKEEEIFQEHAIENHPLSFVLFGKKLKEETLDDNFNNEDYNQDFDENYSESYNENYSENYNENNPDQGMY